MERIYNKLFFTSGRKLNISSCGCGFITIIRMDKRIEIAEVYFCNEKARETLMKVRQMTEGFSHKMPSLFREKACFLVEKVIMEITRLMTKLNCAVKFLTRIRHKEHFAEDN
jgi:hypothetical protein